MATNTPLPTGTNTFLPLHRATNPVTGVLAKSTGICTGHVTTNPITGVLDPAGMWRSICWVTDRVALSGDLNTEWPSRGNAQLQAWVDAGITDIIDVRGECSDERFVALNAPHVRYHWFGTHDEGYEQPDAWFEQGVQAADELLADPTRKVMVHCHMGVNRGPTMGFAILVSQWHDPIEVLEAIRAARPIAGILYAEHAIDWWHRTQGTPETVAHRERRRVRDWMSANAVDVSWVISRISRAKAS
ncbi:MAG: hypothetical protein F2873_06815 [Actinobacteria bacterium]|uniref:Unannotated protein n=1 Tax=freshwater metagenome TaxID=449393 RepID=A0A6J6X073_9ZZZZ|nr:hypothetical protein [Actinomycetota bacterium]MSX78719.1 hypothetical protein [Actinomycetota bacterium]